MRLGEVHAPLLIDIRVKPNTIDHLEGATVVYGVRAFGYNENSAVFGDSCFLLPATPFYFESVGKFWPLGLPYFKFGMRS